MRMMKKWGKNRCQHELLRNVNPKRLNSIEHEKKLKNFKKQSVAIKICLS